MLLRVSCARCRATVSRVVPACFAFIEVYSRLGRPVPTRPVPSASRIRATRRRAPPIRLAPPPDPGRELRHAPFPTRRPCTLLSAHRAARLKLLPYMQRNPPPRHYATRCTLPAALRAPRTSTTFIFSRLISRHAAHAVLRAFPERTLTGSLSLPPRAP